MAIYAPPETRAALGNGLLSECQSRALFKDRFADPESSDETKPSRKEWFDALIKRKAERPRSAPWLPAQADLLHARLMSRLMVDLAAGVMKNANVNLDRYGLPFIPGSAVKGCARRMALQALHDWIEVQAEKGSEERPATDDVCAPCCEGFAKPVDMLSAIARIFGWTPEDWKNDKDREGFFKSDFAWATFGDRKLLENGDAPHWFAGSIAFLAASPNRDPGLDLDVVTPHHTKYYQGEKGYEVALDTEDPVPVFFPCVKAQGENDHFNFPLIPLRLAVKSDLDHAKRWLAHGLELLGLGAKTNAGYGWFEVPSLADEKAAWNTKIEKDKIAEATLEAAQHQAELDLKNAHLLAIQPDEESLTWLAGLKPDQLRACINKFQFDDRFWPKAPAKESSEVFQVTLFIYLTEKDRRLFDEERGKPRSKVMLAIRKIAEKYARKLPD